MTADPSSIATTRANGQPVPRMDNAVERASIFDIFLIILLLLSVPKGIVHGFDFDRYHGLPFYSK